jgi:hypothetical protein
MSKIDERAAPAGRGFRVFRRITRDIQVPLWEGAAMDLCGWRCIPAARTGGRRLGDLGRQ